MKVAAYYCEKCGAEVKRTASHCPSCGMSFSAVKCPQCSFVGEAALFEDGCPSCGYTAARFDTGKKRQSPSLVEKSAEYPKKGAPGWFYWLLGGILIVLLVVFIITLFSMV